MEFVEFYRKDEKASFFFFHISVPLPKKSERKSILLNVKQTFFLLSEMHTEKNIHLHASYTKKTIKSMFCKFVAYIHEFDRESKCIII